MHDLDVRLFAALYGGARGSWAPAMIALTRLGSGWSALALLPLAGWWRTRRFATALVLAIVAQATTVWAIKLAVGRVRPWIAMGLATPIGAPHDGSFPSGHASGSFCVAAFLAVALPAAWRTPAPASEPEPAPELAPASAPELAPAPAPAWRARLVAAVALGLASLIGVSRVYLGCHFPSDVLAGALLGTCFGAAIGEGYVRRRPALPVLRSARSASSGSPPPPP